MSKFIVYQTTNIINGKIYIGVHKQEQDDSYLGSGAVLKKAINKYGKESFSRDTLFEYDTKKEAYDKEIELVDEDFVSRHDTYNMKTGGLGNGIFYPGLVNVRDSKGKGMRVSIDDPRYLSGELISIVTGSGNPMFGKKQSKESNEKNRQWHLGKIASDETKAKISASLSGENAPNFKGYWITPIGKHVSLGEAQNATGIATRNISRYCVDYSNKKITNHTFTVSAYMKTLGKREEIVGKTFSEIGFGFQSKNDSIEH